MTNSRQRQEKIKTFILSWNIGRNEFDDEGSQNHLIFQPISNTFAMPDVDTETIIVWKPKESIKSPTTPGNSLAPKLKWVYNSKIAVEFKGR